MTDRLPLTNAQLAFGLHAQREGQKGTISLRFRAPASRLSTDDLRQVLGSVVRQNSALSHRIRFSRGAAYQEWCPTDCDFAELRTESEDAVSRLLTDVVTEYEGDLDGAPMSARLIRSPESDHLVLVFDHALVDEQSLLLIRRQLSAPSHPDGRERPRYEAAVNDRAAFERAAGVGPGVEFWTNRLGAVRGKFPDKKLTAPRAAPFVAFPSVAIPRAFRGSLFPYVLFSLHRAVRDVTIPEAIVIGYPWGARSGAFSDVVGCFMNTVISLETTSPQQPDAGMASFLDGWLQEIDHADVPFTALLGLGSEFSGAVTAYLSFTHATGGTVNVAGVDAVEVLPTHDSIPSTSAFEGAAAVHGDELRLRLVVSEEAVDFGVQELGTRWRHWISEAISGSPKQRS